MAALANATSFTSPLANAQLTGHATRASGLVGRLLAQLNGWTVFVTLLLVLVAYDQCET